LAVGFVPGVTLTKWRTIWAERFGWVSLDVVEVPQADQGRALADGEVDLCFVRLPLATDGLHLIRLYQEQPVAWVSKDHPVAAFDEVSQADLAEETVLTNAEPASIDLAGVGEAVLQVPQSIARSYSRRDFVYRPITDAPTTEIGLAWRTDNPSELIEEFIGIVRGRTVNSSRTTQARVEKAGGDQAQAARKPPAKQPPGKKPPAQRSGRGRPRRRG
jgi:DNA-binding transcriptional LysR family regulator